VSLWGSLFRDSFWLRRYVSVNARGTETHGEAEQHRCRYEPSHRLVLAADGRQQVAEASLFTSTEVTVKDLVWPPGADPEDIGASRKPRKVATHRNPLTGRIDHYEVTL